MPLSAELPSTETEHIPLRRLYARHLGLACTPQRRSILYLWDLGCTLQGCFSLRTSMNDCPVLVSDSPGNNTPICLCPWFLLTAGRILPLTNFELKVLASSSSLSRVVLVGCDQHSATVSAKRASYWQIFHRFSRRVILWQILWYLHARGVVCKITLINTMGRSSFQRCSLASRNSSARHFMNRRPTSPWGAQYPSSRHCTYQYHHLQFP